MKQGRICESRTDERDQLSFLESVSVMLMYHFCLISLIRPPELRPVFKVQIRLFVNASYVLRGARC